jgi:hypothetical protein
MEKLVYAVQFDFTTIAITATLADAEELACDLAFEHGHYYYNLHRNVGGRTHKTAMGEALYNMEYIRIVSFPFI